MKTYSKLVPFINCEGVLPEHVLKLAENYKNSGADELFLFNYSTDEANNHEFLA